MTRRLSMAMIVVSAGMAACGGHDAPAPVDQTAPTKPQSLNGCGPADYVDPSSGDAVVQIAVDGLRFTPPCISVAAGRSVRFEGSLTAHPLAPGNSDDPEAGSPGNPISATSSGNSVEFTFDSAGTYAYYCELHSFGAGQGMAGAVQVR